MLTSSAFRNAVLAGAQVSVLVEVEHPDGDGYFWEGQGALEYNGKTYKGAALFGGITRTRKTTDLRVDEMRMFMTGLDPEEVGQLNGNIRNKIARIRLAAMNSDGQVVAVEEVDEILLDYQVDRIGDDRSASLEVIGQSGFFTLERTTDRSYSQEEAKLEYPDESGFSQIPSLRNKDTPWTQS